MSNLQAFFKLQLVLFTKFYYQLTHPAIKFSKLAIKTLEQGVQYEHISHLVLVFLLLNLSM